MTVTSGPDRVTADVRAGIEELVAEHAWILDHGDPRDLPRLYTADGELLGLGDPLVGQAALQGWADRRATLTERTSRHVHTNLRLRTGADGTVRGTLMTLLYRHDGAGTGPSWPLLVLDYTDVYAREGDRWLFASRSIERVFTDPDREAAR
ncbi:nuclear transport factor 2 family protein [Pseudonocardia sp. WMMC193]|uniref:nuclear transport factor 2 family protein n=1 Tax=Pseudonocardia sp. WMMC193 TaxID=2911965 RepID=UPI001F2DE591|nr:nuclear transport factor 2 family protein [Pseudonocardia sp. WMMC193]MCF7547924.1 nuclear transport factor 2 family protein [Pseudonocardia sp. WMMC193]